MTRSLEDLAGHVARIWRELEAATPRRLGPALRDGTSREVVDGDHEAFQRARPKRGSWTLPEAQQAVVTGIEVLERRTGAHRPVLRLVLRVLERRAPAPSSGRELRVFEAAAGSGWHALELWRRARSRGLRPDLVATELNPSMAARMEQRFAGAGVPCKAQHADVRHLAGYEDAGFHVAYMIYTLHHLAPPEAAAALRELDRVSGGGMVVVDLDRSLAGLLASRLLAPFRVLPGCAFLVHDGLVSVRRAYTRRELRALLEACGLERRYRVSRVPTLHPLRLVANAIHPG